MDSGIRITIIGMVVNLVLTIAKIIVGTLFHSLSLVSDGIHSLSDLVTDLIAIISLKISNKPADSDHQYGHGKFDTIASTIIGFILLYAAIQIVIKGLTSAANHESLHIGISIIVVSIFSIISKEILFRYTKKIALEKNSSVLLSNAYHHRSDSLSSIVVLIGGILQWAGYNYGDQLSAIIVGSMIGSFALQIIYSSVTELTESSAGEKIEKLIKNKIDSLESIKQYHKIRTRKVGGVIFVDFHIQVDGNMSVNESHAITGKLKAKINEESEIPINILIHVEPEEN